ncbi:MAG: type I restriction enzyme HsdR N-terminal domain-containing protein [Candidatus Shikimatogenerans bostrichidophilus]|nr:MAG: type I restriction enzyme HsdR N-terminal domain-containing protein [Candidatus Shikimatogenerans bostrichidophilus]
MNNINNYLKKKKIKIYKSPLNKKKTIFCIKRKKFYLLNNEELLRQKIIFFLIKVKMYNLYDIEVEKIFKKKNNKIKIDILVNKKKKPYIIIECKTSKKCIIKKNFYQLLQYSNYLNNKYLLLTNGIENIFLKKKKNNKLIFINDIPNKK